MIQRFLLVCVALVAIPIATCCEFFGDLFANLRRRDGDDNDKPMHQGPSDT